VFAYHNRKAPGHSHHAFAIILIEKRQGIRIMQLSLFCVFPRHEAVNG
jgi:hypothetical protein